MKLSVISIAYNNLRGLQKTLEVFEKERFASDIEIVVVDGGSRDGSKEYLEQQKLGLVWVSESDHGIYHAMNKGLAMARGEYVWFLNSGDYVESPETIATVLKALEDKPDAVYGETMMVDAEGKHLGTRSEISTRKLPPALNWRSFRTGMNVGHQSFIIRRALALPYDEKYRFVSDIDWMIRCLHNCRKVKNLQTVLACFTLDGFSSQNRGRSNKERYKVLKRHYGFFPNILAHLQISVRKLFARKKI